MYKDAFQYSKLTVVLFFFLGGGGVVCLFVCLFLFLFVCFFCYFLAKRCGSTCVLAYAWLRACPTPKEKSKKQHKKRHQNFDYTTITDRLSEEVIKMWYTNINGNLKVYQKYIGGSI